ncbi:hypothetical protein EUX98_g3347 [Antrodiella citrinella]|uniref:NAD(P)-binding domain-containing protein n=1 Tax=Antrodiella citrinella TaxID=2447956 RepID=A0A4S4MXY8_9APHY|nr:hypothetical protein EUX98_g3347 [Antrodiella citrinella]
MKLLLTGATGAAGLNIYRAALADPTVDRITLLMRRELPAWAVLPANASAKTTTIVHADFTSYSPDLVSELVNHDACIWTLGISAAGKNEAYFTHITYDYPVALLNALIEGRVGTARPAHAPFRFVWFSGASADETEKSLSMSPRVKGRTENAILKLCDDVPGMQAHILRPGGFHPSAHYPEDAKHQRRRWESVIRNIPWPLLKVPVPAILISAEQLSRAALAVAKGLYPGQIRFDNQLLLDISAS